MVRFGGAARRASALENEAIVATSLIARQERERVSLAPWLFPAVVGLLALLFLVAPGTIAAKAHWAVHGLCAQTPSHSLTFGGQRLPFDARMTGIYAGALSTAAWLLRRGRFRAWRLPPIRVLAVLALSVAALGIDGANSLAHDLGLATPYAPSNVIRLATGLATGTALATALCFLLATTLWRAGEDRATLTGLREWALLGVVQAPLAAALLSGDGLLFAPAAMALVAAATGAIAALVTASGLLVFGRDRRCVRWRDAAPAATLALLAAVAIMAAACAGRIALESVAGPSPLT